MSMSNAIVFRLACLALLVSALPVQAVAFKVGADAACDFTSVQDAFDAAKANGPGMDSVYIATNQAYTAQALSIVDHDVWIFAGVPDCSTNTVVAGSRTHLSGAGNGGLPVLSITAPGSRRGNVIVWDLELSDGHASAAQGGGLRVEGNLQLTMEGLWLHDNSAQEGGGAWFKGLGNGSTLSVQSVHSQAGNGSIIEGNQAVHGGGIYADLWTSVSVADTLVSANNAVMGGGVYLTGSSSNAYASVPPDSPTGGGIRNNVASFDGGGLYATAGAQFSTQRYPGYLQFQVQGNQAGRDGGGVHATNGASFQFEKAAIIGNQAGMSEVGHGGGIYTGNGAWVVLSGGAPDDGSDRSCLQALPCAALDGNEADLGGGAFADLGSSISVVMARIAENHALAAAVLEARGADSTISVGSALVHGNSAVSGLLRAQAGAKFVLTGSTLADNAVAVLLDLVDSDAEIRASILHQPGTPALASSGASSRITQCVIASDDFDPSGDVRVVDPQFVDAAMHDYRLADASPAIDACGPTSGFFRDYALRLRGIDQIDVVDNGGPYDIGAFEMPSRDVIFADPFELVW
ncbi:MAG: hypothetical protein K8F35_00330 [Dokdonella sp.]|uniref:hypothetical protein n=1 Tax=Dokdonella sp. TaxID=2291710 RepID=UPI0025BBFA9E|nr:hypothetical protein [Dokdonella sp.]MBZ0221450.1 hypothetical protein [Dokdonella sp.]